MSQQFSVDEVLGVVDDEEHDGLGHEVTCGLSHDLHVRVHQVAYGLHLPLQHWVHGRGAFAAALPHTHNSALTIVNLTAINSFIQGGFCQMI